MIVLTPEKIKQAVSEAHERNPGKILTIMEIYGAIAQAQYGEDTKMEIAEKVKLLKGLDTKGLVEKLHQYEDALEKTMTDEAAFKAQNRDFLGSGDCQEVKRILAELSIQGPETNGLSKKMTIADKEVWLMKQRTENKELNDAITKQRQIAFLLDDHQIKVEMAKKRLEGTKAVLALKTAQINFLAAG